MDDSAFYASLSREERLRRVGILFSKAVTIISERERLKKELKSETLKQTDVTREVIEWQEHEATLFKRFSRLGEFSPREAVRFWATSRTSCYRRLQKLEKEGWITRSGRTNAVRYRFTARTQLVLERLKESAQADSIS